MSCKVTKTVSTDHNFLREKRAEAESNRWPFAYQPNILPQGQTGSHTRYERRSCLSASCSWNSLSLSILDFWLEISPLVDRWRFNSHCHLWRFFPPWSGNLQFGTRWLALFKTWCSPSCRGVLWAGNVGSDDGDGCLQLFHLCFGKITVPVPGDGGNNTIAKELQWVSYRILRKACR